MSFSARMFACLLSLAFSMPGLCAEKLSEEAMYARLSALAPKGNPEVQYHLGMLLNNGIGTARDNPAAFRWFAVAAEAGDALAAYKLGCYLAGQFPGVVPVNQTEALRYKLRAAEAGYEFAQYDVGLTFAKTGEKDNALPWLERASRQGNLQATAILVRLLSDQTPPDLSKAYALLQLLRERLPKPGEQLSAQLARLDATLTAEQKAGSEASRASWLTGPTPLTLKARTGISGVPALLASLEP